MKLLCASAVTMTIALLAGQAAGATYPFTLHNLTNKDVTKVSIPKGKIVDFKRIPASQSFTFKVEFPDGECFAPRVRAKLFGGETVDLGRYNVCSGSGMTIVGR